MATAAHIADKLDQARAVLEMPGGWHQGRFDNGCGGYCAIGAINLVVRESGLTWHKPGDAIAAAVGLRSRYEIGKWNDAPERTQAEVIDAFKRAAELARSEGQ